MKNLLLSCAGGNVLEWYDFALYAYFAGAIGRVAFPHQGDNLSLLIKTYGIFFAGFLTRPLGGMLFGYIGDVYGRKKALMLSIYSMAIPTALIGLLPSYNNIGYWSPILLSVLRLFQGLSMGGEFTGTMIFVVESAPHKKKSFWGSWASLSAILGLVMGSGIGTLMTVMLAKKDLDLWGWRIPFLASLLGSWVASRLRKDMDESHTQQKRTSMKQILNTLFTHHKKAIRRVLLADVVVAMGFFIVYTYNAIYLHEVLGHGRSFSSSLGTIGLLVSIPILPLSGLMGDRYGPQRIMRYSSGALCLLAAPCFWVFCTQSTLWIALCHIILSVIMASIFAVMPSFLVSMFPANIRYSGISIAHNLCMAFLGGSAPNIATSLIHKTGNAMMPGVLLSIAALVSFVSLKEK